jgi:hypothetical protein
MSGSASEPEEKRSFVAASAVAIWYGDVMHGPRVSVDGKPRKVYLVRNSRICRALSRCSVRANNRAKTEGRARGCILCRFLDRINPDHCQKSRGV